MLDKILTSGAWKTKFIKVAQRFAKLKTDLFDLINIYTARGTTAIIGTLAEIKQNFQGAVERAFESKESMQEQSIRAFLKHIAKTPEEVLNNDELLEQIINMGRSPTDKLAASGKVEVSLTPLALEEARRDIKRDLKDVIKDNQGFDRKFTALSGQLKRLESILHSGAHDGIKDHVSRVHGPTPIVAHLGSHVSHQELADLWKSMARRLELLYTSS